MKAVFLQLLISLTLLCISSNLRAIDVGFGELDPTILQFLKTQKFEAVTPELGRPFIGFERASTRTLIAFGSDQWDVIAGSFADHVVLGEPSHGIIRVNVPNLLAANGSDNIINALKHELMHDLMKNTWWSTKYRSALDIYDSGELSPIERRKAKVKYSSGLLLDEIYAGAVHSAHPWTTKNLRESVSYIESEFKNSTHLSLSQSARRFQRALMKSPDWGQSAAVLMTGYAGHDALTSKRSLRRAGITLALEKRRVGQRSIFNRASKFFK